MRESGLTARQAASDAVRRVGYDALRVRRGFTLVELLVVIAVIGILVALVLPAVQQARAAARRTQCRNHLHQIGIALHSYHDLHNTLPPGSIVMGPSFPTQSGWGWSAFILPQLEQSALYDQLDFHIGSAAGSNRPLIAHSLPVFRCPSDVAPQTISASLPGGGSAEIAHGNYPGSEPMLAALSHTRFRDVVDGLSQSLLVGEWTYVNAPIGESTVSWCGLVSDGIGYQFVASLPHLTLFPGVGVNDSAAFHSRHAGGTHFLIGDGSVQFLGESTDAEVYYALSTINGGEAVSSPF